MRKISIESPLAHRALESIFESWVDFLGFFLFILNFLREFEILKYDMCLGFDVLNLEQHMQG